MASHLTGSRKKVKRAQNEAQRSGFVLKRRGKGADVVFVFMTETELSELCPDERSVVLMEIEKMTRAVFLWTLLEKIEGATAEEHFNRIIDQLIERLPCGERERMSALWNS